MFEETVARFGTVHVLVNNAGIQSGGRFQEMTLGQWRRVLAVNLDGQFLCAREAVREFLRRGPQPELSAATGQHIRSEERRVGKGCARTVISRGSRDHKKQKTTK